MEPSPPVPLGTPTMHANGVGPLGMGVGPPTPPNAAIEALAQQQLGGYILAIQGTCKAVLTAELFKVRHLKQFLDKTLTALEALNAEIENREKQLRLSYEFQSDV